MKKTKLALTIAAIVAAPSAFAAGFQMAAPYANSSSDVPSYQMEARIGHQEISVDNDHAGPGYDSDITATNASFSFYLAPVKTKDVPLAEAAFLGHNSRFSINYTHGAAVIDGIGIQIPTDDNLDIFNATADLWFDQFYLSAELGQVVTKQGDDAETHAVKLGFMLQDGWLTYLGAHKLDWPGAQPTGKVNPDDITTKIFGTKYVGNLGENSIAFDAEYRDNDTTDTLKVGGDFYFTHSLSAGVDVKFARVDCSGTCNYTVSNWYGANVRYFITPAISTELSYTKAENSDLELSSDNIALQLTARF